MTYKNSGSLVMVSLSMLILMALPAYAQTSTSSQSNIQTYSTATSSVVVITSPSGYKSEVISDFDGKQFHTFATSTPLTAQDIASMRYNMLAEEQDMQQLLEAEQAMFNREEQMFQNLWGNFGM